MAAGAGAFLFLCRRCFCRALWARRRDRAFGCATPVQRRPALHTALFRKIPADESGVSGGDLHRTRISLYADRPRSRGRAFRNALPQGMGPAARDRRRGLRKPGKRDDEFVRAQYCQTRNARDRRRCGETAHDADRTSSPACRRDWPAIRPEPDGAGGADQNPRKRRSSRLSGGSERPDIFRQ